MPIFKSLVWLDLEKSCRKRNSNPGSSALEADALTTRPTRRSGITGSVTGLTGTVSVYCDCGRWHSVSILWYTVTVGDGTVSVYCDCGTWHSVSILSLWDMAQCQYTVTVGHGTMLVYCDCGRWQILFTTSTSVWQHVQIL